MATVEELIRGKGPDVYAVTPYVTVLEAIALMVQHNVGALGVLEADEPCGIITERDYLRRVVLQGRSSKTTFVKEIMSTGLVSVELQETSDSCMKLMTEHRIRHLIVVRDGILAGVLSIGDIVKHLASERESMIHQLTEYIQGRA